jgi:hypothetical protein
MSQATTISRGISASAGFAAPGLRQAFVDVWQTLAKSFSDPYRPEKHYMRGPGPKWREKHGAGASAALRS